jgi:hypothetical protein
MNNEILDELNSAFVKPVREFKGSPLANYTEGSRLLMYQIKEDTDTSIWFVWCFLFLHLELAKNKQQAIKYAWNKELFREKMFQFLEDKTETDREIATSLVSNIINEANNSRIEVTENNTGTSTGKA